MNTEEEENIQEVVWTIIVQKVRTSEDPLVYKIIMKYYGEEPIPVMNCEEDSVEWIKQDT